VEILVAVSQFEDRSGASLHKLTSAMMILLPKVKGAAKLTEFRPRSLIHGFAKLVAKILARRLQPRMAEPAPPCQSAFYQAKIHS
jgi:hypothetical protein